MVSNIDFISPKKYKERTINYCRGRFGNLLEKDWGAKNPSGTAYLYISGELRCERNFKDKKERKLIFQIWNKQYNPKYHDNMYIEIKYNYLNEHQRKLSREDYKLSLQSIKHYKK